MNVRKAAKTRNRYNQVPLLTKDTSWESDKITLTCKSQEVSHFPAGEHKTVMKRRESMKNTDINNIHIFDGQ